MARKQPTRRAVLEATGRAVTGLAVAAVAPPALTAAADGALSPVAETHWWLLETGRPGLEPGLYEVVAQAIRSKDGTA